MDWDLSHFNPNKIRTMSTNKTKSSKRALPRVPLARSGSADFINTATLKSNYLPKHLTGSSTSKVSSPLAKESWSTPTTPEKILIRKSSAPVGVLRQQLMKDSLFSTRRRLLEQRRDSSNSSSSDSPISSRKGSKENLSIIQDDECATNEDGSYKTNDRKIARVLPMSPALLTAEIGTSNTTPYIKKPREFDVPLRNINKKDHYINTPECTKTQTGTPKTPFGVLPTTPHTPYQVPNLTDEDSCSIAVAVRVRPLSQRYGLLL